MVKVQNKAFCPFFFFSFPTYYTYSVLNTSVKVSGGGHHYLPRKTSLKLLGYVRLGWLGYV